jgi:hypothetical protein
MTAAQGFTAQADRFETVEKPVDRLWKTGGCLRGEPGGIIVQIVGMACGQGCAFVLQIPWVPDQTAGRCLNPAKRVGAFVAPAQRPSQPGHADLHGLQPEDSMACGPRGIGLSG